MTATYAMRGSRQPLVLTAILGLHVAVIFLVASGLGHRALDAVPPKQPPIKVVFMDKDPVVIVKPGRPDPLDPHWVRVPEPIVPLPTFPEFDRAPAAGADAGLHSPSDDARRNSGTEFLPPALRTRDRRLATLIDSCYPAASRRLSEEGRAVARITIGADGKARGWRVAETSGFSRLDEAMGCVIEPLDFVAGRLDGRAVEAEASLPIIFRLD